MNWRAFDLNLLVVFDGLFREGSVTRAGKTLGMSQPALSHALNRLRSLLEDPLFIRTPKGMVPTPRAEQLALPVRQALTHNLRPSGTVDVFDHLDRGDLDVSIGTFGAVGERFTSAVVLEDRFVAVMRKGHPAARTKLSPETFGALQHLEISSSGDDTGFIDRSLMTRGARRRVSVRLPYLSAGVVLGQSNMVATLSRRIAEAMIQGGGLQIRDLPFTSPTVRTSMVWHRRLEGSAAHRWLRELIGSVCRDL